MNILEHVVGPLPVGDVDAMRRLASDIRSRANDIRHHGDLTGAQPDAMCFSGPAANAFRDFAREERDHIGGVAADLEHQAWRIEQEANETANAQNTWHRRADRVRHEIHRIENAGERAVDRLDDLRRSIF